MKEVSPPSFSIPSLTPDELKGVKDFWKEYEVHRDKTVAESLRMAREHPGFKFVLQNDSSLLTAGESNTNVETQRRAIFHGDWEPFLQDLRREGVLFAQAGLSFQAWTEVVGATRKAMLPFLLAAYGESPEQLLSAINGMDRFVNIVTGVVGEGFLWAKEQLIHQQKEILWENRQQLAGIINSAMDAIIIINEDQRIQIFNPAAGQMFGYSAEEVRGKPLTMLIPDRLRQKHEADVRVFGKDSVTKRAMGRLGMVFGLRADGEEFPLEVSISQNEIIGGKTYTAILRDITERKRAEEALRASEQLFHRTLDNMLEGVQIVDFDWRYRYVNDAVVLQGRASRETLMGRRMDEVYPGIENTELFAVLQRCMQERSSQKMLNEFSYSDGDKRWFELSIQPIPEGIFILSIDNTERRRAEEALRLENERLLRLTNSNIVGIAITDGSEKIVLANDYYLNLLGVTRQDFDQGKVDWRTFTPPEWLLADEKALRELRERGVSEPFEKEYLQPDGTRVSVYIAEAMLPGPDEQIVAFVLDITERKQAEKELRESEEKLRLFIEHAPASLAMFDREMRYLAVSHRWLIDYGIGELNILGESHYDIFPEIPDRWKVVHQNGLAGEVSLAEKDRFVRKDGSVQWLRWEVRPWNITDGDIGGIVIFSEDITDRVMAEEALRESEERFRKAIVEAPRPILIHDEDGVNIEISKGWTQFSGYTLEDIPTMAEWAKKAYGERSEYAKEYIDQLFEINETVSNGEWLITTKNGEQRVWDFYATPIGISREGKRILLSTAVDVTERKQAEAEAQMLNQELEKRVFLRTAQLEAANKELEAFSYSVSHDLRAPLRSIDGFSLALLDDYIDELPEEGKHYLERIRTAAQRMAQLIDDLLNLSRVSRSPLERSTVNLSALAKEIADELRRAEPERDTKFIIMSSMQVEADGRLMKIVLANLLGNAWKFTSQKEGARIEFGAKEGENGFVYSVRDNGSGFDMAYVDKLFGAFQRLHTASEFPGSGVGLAIVQRIIHRHGGEIWAESSQDAGATFYFTV